MPKAFGSRQSPPVCVPQNGKDKAENPPPTERVPVRSAEDFTMVSECLSKNKRDKAHWSRSPDGVVPIPMGRRKATPDCAAYWMNIASFFSGAKCSFKKQARQGAPEPPARRRSSLRRGGRRGATPDCAAYWMNIASPKLKKRYRSRTAVRYASKICSRS